MIHEKILKDEKNEKVFLETYAVNDPVNTPRDAILVIPGGGYSGVSVREGQYTALAFLAKGYNTFVLTYSVGDDAVFPGQLLDAAWAMKYIKENAEKYHVNPNRIFALGYSAGGHLLGTLLTLHGLAEEKLGLKKDYIKPTGGIFCYPVITAYGPTHTRSFSNLLKKPFEAMTEEEREMLSIEKNINENTPPAFIWHTAGDKGVPIFGSLKLCGAYYAAGVAVEMHVFPYGPHGIALGTEYTSNANPDMIQPRATIWVDEAIKWMEGIK
jgi:acetyl esterase/lipase